MTSPRLLITLCTYNELENLPKLVEEIHQFAEDAEILVIDDNSPDGTGKLADELSEKDSRIHVLHREGKLGLGTATMAGFQYGIDQNYDFILNMDADFSHHPRYISALRECMEEADVGIGSRYIKGGGVEGWGFRRHFMSQGINCYARIFLGLKTKDNSGSFRCYRVTKLREIDFSKIRAKGYAFQEEILYRCRKVGCTFKETPIIFEDRMYGTSKINNMEAVSALWVIFRLGIDSLFGVSVTKN